MAHSKTSLVLLAAFLVASGVACGSSTARPPVADPVVAKTSAHTPPASKAPNATAMPSRDGVLGEAIPTATRSLLATAMRSPTSYRNAKGLELPGPCWDARKHATIVREIVDESGAAYVMPEDLAFDLDDDGKPDPVLEVDRADGVTRYELYVQNGTCANHVGGLTVSGTIRLGRGSTKGLRNLELEAACESACCDELRHTELVFDGKGYVPGKIWTTPTSCKK